MKIHLNLKNSILLGSAFIFITTVCTYLVITATNHDSRVSFNSSEVKEANETVDIVYDDTPTIPSITPESISVDISFFGDIFWGRYVHDWSMASSEQFNYPFSQLDSIGKEDGEYWVGNLECPITDQALDAATQENLLKFNCLPDYLPYASEWFDAFSLANNHTDNMEEFNGYSTTQSELLKNDIVPFGHFDNDLNNTCTVVSIPAQKNYSLDQEEAVTSNRARIKHNKVTIPTALCGFHGVFRQLTDDEINHISDFAKHLPTFVLPHTGAEYTNIPDSIKTRSYRAMIDAGADAVIGGHPHAVQSTEVYNNKLIVYSQGNFIFDQQFSTMVTTHLGITSSLNVSNEDMIDAWQKIPASCFNITTLCPAIQSLSAKPQLNITHNPFYTASDNKITKVANPSQEAYIKNASNIESTLTLIQN